MSIDFPKAEFAVIENGRRSTLSFERHISFNTYICAKTKNQYTFYDSPPCATGLPHYGYLLASTIKNILPRYLLTKGNRGDGSAKIIPEAVKKFRLANYNHECSSIVMRYREKWRHTIEKLGRWIKIDDD
ncbi:isoleucyl-tRNA synthetase [Xylaria flabelliformis]|nr:isoleucyl-tRNA synthetase [Xylaria flabelliformis]